LIYLKTDADVGCQTAYPEAAARRPSPLPPSTNVL
jgi:hypothetical protein